MKELLKIMGLALAAMIIIALGGISGIALLSVVIVPLIGLLPTIIIMLVLLFVIICVKIRFEMKNWRNING